LALVEQATLPVLQRQFSEIDLILTMRRPKDRSGAVSYC
jgi:hypothetical protein